MKNSDSSVKVYCNGVYTYEKAYTIAVDSNYKYYVLVNETGQNDPVH